MWRAFAARCKAYQSKALPALHSPEFPLRIMGSPNSAIVVRTAYSDGLQMRIDSSIESRRTMWTTVGMRKPQLTSMACAFAHREKDTVR